MKNIAPIYITKPFLPPFEEFNEGLKRIWNSRMLTNFGPLYTELLSCLKNYLQVENLSLVVNGHQALEIAISALQLSGEVTTTPFTFASTTHAIVRSGPSFAKVRIWVLLVSPYLRSAHCRDCRSPLSHLSSRAKLSPVHYPSPRPVASHVWCSELPRLSWTT